MKCLKTLVVQKQASMDTFLKISHVGQTMLVNIARPSDLTLHFGVFNLIDLNLSNVVYIKKHNIIIDKAAVLES